MLDIMLIIRVSEQLIRLSGAEKGHRNWLNPLLMQMFHVIYIQYKFNRAAES